MATVTKKTAPTRKKQTTRRTSTRKKKKTANYSAYIIANIVIALLFAVFLYTSATGVLGKTIRDALLGFFGSCAYIIPLMAVGTTIYMSRQKNISRFFVKIILCLILLSLLSAFVHLCGKNIYDMYSAYTYGELGYGGGLVGAVISTNLYKLVGRIASMIMVFAAIVVTCSILIRISIVHAVGTFFSGFFEEMRSVEQVDTSEVGNKAGKKAKKAKKAVEKQVINVQNIMEEARLRPLENAIDLPLEVPGTALVDTQTGEILSETPEKKRGKKKRKKEEQPLSEDSEKEVILDSSTQTPPWEDVFVAPPDMPVQSQTVSLPEIQSNIDTKQTQKKADTISGTEQEKMNDELSKMMDKPSEEYVFPPIDLLNHGTASSPDSRATMKETATKLVETLKSFGVEVKLLQVTQGPTVTRYEIQPNIGVKLSKIVNLADDLALNLAVSNVLIAPVPGKAAIGIEVPNNEVSSVSARELIESDEFQKAKSKLAVALGKDIGGKTVVGDIAKMPHVLIAGATGSGKSVCINTLITSILYHARPDEVKLIMVDPKVVELGVYNGIPHLLIPVVTDPKRAAGALNWAVQEMMKRYDLFAETKVRNLSGYNTLMKKTGGEKLPQLVIIIDELADLMMVAAKEVEDYVCRLAQLARAAGIHLVIATQRPSVDVITGLIKANIPSRIAFSVSSQVDSRTILDKGGAEKLLGRGDMLYAPSGAPTPQRVQGAFVSDEEIENIVGFLKEHSEENSYSEDLAEHIERCSSGEGHPPDEQEDGDELLPSAIELAVEAGQISTSMIQRRLKVGYARAGRIIDQMEMRGIISGADGSKPRQVYMSKDEFFASASQSQPQQVAEEDDAEA